MAITRTLSFKCDDMNRWSLFVDIEGFSKLYLEQMARALRPLCNLMEGIYCIGSRVCPETPHRLLADQIGDAELGEYQRAIEDMKISAKLGDKLAQDFLKSKSIES
jgi:hypothetical protein